MKDGGTVDLNVNGTYTLGTVTEVNGGTGFTPTFDANVPGNADGFGTFSLSLNNKDGVGDSADTVTIDLTKSSGTWANAADVLTANGSGWFAAAHIFVTTNTSPANAMNGALATGFAASDFGTGKGSPPPAPDGGSTVALLGSALVGLGLLRRKTSRK